MKSHYFITLVVAMCCMSIAFISCKSNDPIVPPAPPTCTVTGIVTNEANQPLDSIQFVLDHTAFAEWKEFEKLDSLDALKFTKYSDEHGEYQIGVAKIHIEDTTWPEEVTITASDPAGVYESQTQTVPVETFSDFKDPRFKNYVIGRAKADFVLKKKN